MFDKAFDQPDVPSVVCLSRDEAVEIIGLFGDIAKGRSHEHLRDATSAAWGVLVGRWAVGMGVGYPKGPDAEARLWAQIAERPRPWIRPTP